MHTYWVSVIVAKEEGLTRKIKVKPFAYGKDMQKIMQTLFSPAHIATFRNTHEVLLIALFINIISDNSGRIGELLATRRGTKKGKTTRSNVLRWGQDVKIWVMRNNRGVPELGGTFTTTVSKQAGHKLLRKGTPLFLTPPNLALQDSLRLLVTLALIEGHFEDVTSWEDILKFDPGATEKILRFKPSSLSVPIFRVLGTEDDYVPRNWIMVRLRRLGIAAGFRHGLTSYAFRRAAGYIIESHCSRDDVRSLMGHSAKSLAMRAYRSQISPFYLQFARLGLELKDVTMFSGISLGSTSGAPTCLSDQGFMDIARNQDVIIIQEKIRIELDNLLCKCGMKTIAEMETRNSAMLCNYTRLLNERIFLIRDLTAARYKQEYATWLNMPKTRETSIYKGKVFTAIDPALYLTPDLTFNLTLGFILNYGYNFIFNPAFNFTLDLAFDIPLEPIISYAFDLTLGPLLNLTLNNNILLVKNTYKFLKGGKASGHDRNIFDKNSFILIELNKFIYKTNNISLKDIKDHVGTGKQLKDKLENKLKNELEDGCGEGNILILSFSVVDANEASTETTTTNAVALYINRSYRAHGSGKPVGRKVVIGGNYQMTSRPTIANDFYNNICGGLVQWDDIGTYMLFFFRLQHDLTLLPLSLLHPKGKLECSRCSVPFGSKTTADIYLHVKWCHGKGNRSQTWCEVCEAYFPFIEGSKEHEEHAANDVPKMLNFITLNGYNFQRSRGRM
ncbi:hypothetical protein MMC18_004238 [Xylographa bjoerkii]|nr:hypothetical protein [Xylographa bjoerkii]